MGLIQGIISKLKQLNILYLRNNAFTRVPKSIRNLKKVTEDLLPHYGEGCPVCIAYRVTWPDQKILFGTLSNIREKVRAEKITRTALILVGDVFGAQDFIDSKLYTKDHKHILRPK